MSEQYVLSRRERKKRDCKYTILRSARELMKEKGLDVSIEEIAGKAEISYPTFFNYFPTKSDLYYAIYLEEIEDVKEFIEIELTEETSAVERLNKLFDALLHDFTRYSFLDLYIAGEAAKITAASGTNEPISDMIEDTIKLGCASGEYKSNIPAANYALLIVGILLTSSFSHCNASNCHDMLDIIISSMKA